MSASNANVRTLRIEAIGDFARSKIKPRIRLTGQWLEKAGFRPGHWVEISSSRPGELSLRFKDDSFKANIRIQNGPDQ